MSNLEGLHPARCTGFEHGVSKEKNTQSVRLHFRITDGEHKHRSVAWDGWLSEAAAERTAEQLGFCGWDGVSMARLNGITRREVLLDIVSEENPEKPGQYFPKVNWVRRLGVKPLPVERRMAPLDVRMLDAKFAHLLREAPAPEATSSNGAAPPDEDDFGNTDYDGMPA